MSEYVSDMCPSPYHERSAGPHQTPACGGTFAYRDEQRATFVTVISSRERTPSGPFAAGGENSKYFIGTIGILQCLISGEASSKMRGAPPQNSDLSQYRGSGETGENKLVSKVVFYT